MHPRNSLPLHLRPVFLVLMANVQRLIAEGESPMLCLQLHLLSAEGTIKYEDGCAARDWIQTQVPRETVSIDSFYPIYVGEIPYREYKAKRIQRRIDWLTYLLDDPIAAQCSEALARLSVQLDKAADVAKWRTTGSFHNAKVDDYIRWSRAEMDFAMSRADAGDDEWFWRIVMRNLSQFGTPEQ